MVTSVLGLTCNGGDFTDGVDFLEVDAAFFALVAAFLAADLVVVLVEALVDEALVDVLVIDRGGVLVADRFDLVDFLVFLG